MLVQFSSVLQLAAFAACPTYNELMVLRFGMLPLSQCPHGMNGCDCPAVCTLPKRSLVLMHGAIALQRGQVAFAAAVGWMMAHTIPDRRELNGLHEAEIFS